MIILYITLIILSIIAIIEKIYIWVNVVRDDLYYTSSSELKIFLFVPFGSLIVYIKRAIDILNDKIEREMEERK
jgi:hypothetical protein